MAASSIYLGMVTMPGRWHNGVKLGHVNTFPGEWVIDETLPSLGQDGNHPNRDFVVIPRGRAVAAKPTTLTRLASTTIVTLATGVDPLLASPPSFLDGKGNFPLGYSLFHLYRDFAGLPADKPVPTTHESIEVPYTSTNESYNKSWNGGTRLVAGEWVMPYFGSATSKTAIAADKGKFVRFVPRTVHNTTVTASAQVLLDRAPFPAFVPRLIAAFNGATPMMTGATLYSYNEAHDAWVIEFGGPVTTVIYEYGAHDAMRMGQILGIEPVDTAGGINATSHDLRGWLQWVTQDYGRWDYPAIIGINPSTKVTLEEVTITDGEGTLANTPIVPSKAITVVVTGTLIDPDDGTETTLTGETLALAEDHFFNDYSQGQYYNIDWLTGTITFSSNLTVTTCNVTYYYETDYKDGRQYDAGQFGLTDGRESGIAGLPSHLDVVGVRGALRIALLP